MEVDKDHFSDEHDAKPVIKTEIKQEYDSDAYIVPDSKLVKVEPIPTDLKPIKEEPELLENDDRYLISSDDLKHLGAIESKETADEPNTETVTAQKVTGKICPHCSVHFPNPKNFKRHVMSHSDERPFQCTLCDSSFKGKYHLTIHVKAHTGERNIQCPYCEKSFIVQSALRAHMRTHSQEKPYVCHICGKGFSHQANLKPHVATHIDGLPFECEECGERVRDRKGLLKHIRLHHVDCKVEGCEFCQKFSKDSEKTLRELQRRSWKCPYCLEEFKYYPTYKKHVKIHNNESFSCNQCDKTYLNIAYLRIHMRNHTGETPLNAMSATRNSRGKTASGYTHRSSLFKHKREIHSIIIERATVSCRVCEKKLEERAFRMHMKKHEIQVFKCRKCKDYIEGEEVFEAHKKIKCTTSGNEKDGASETATKDGVGQKECTMDGEVLSAERIKVEVS
ncbi:hypothetical protein NQ317_015502 [Molorchus minor]|uniref:C2H2-type domain-containing protein n=1 Tax=Molorchus minor TaxID=1323400 RepID=A0ABQ9JLC2_9CUCU|nr:hypothetical protein NQ317_015502 [Molorchus minor]